MKIQKQKPSAAKIIAKKVVSKKRPWWLNAIAVIGATIAGLFTISILIGILPLLLIMGLAVYSVVFSGAPSEEELRLQISDVAQEAIAHRDPRICSDKLENAVVTASWNIMGDGAHELHARSYCLQEYFDATIDKSVCSYYNPQYNADRLEGLCAPY